MALGAAYGRTVSSGMYPQGPPDLPPGIESLWPHLTGRSQSVGGSWLLGAECIRTGLLTGRPRPCFGSRVSGSLPCGPRGRVGGLRTPAQACTRGGGSLLAVRWGPRQPSATRTGSRGTRDESRQPARVGDSWGHVAGLRGLHAKEGAGPTSPVGGPQGLSP
jgi:hypothetical protein